MLLLVIAGVVMIAGHEIGRHMHKDGTKYRNNGSIRGL